MYLQQEKQELQHKQGYFSSKKKTNKAEVLELIKSLGWKANNVMIY